MSLVLVEREFESPITEEALYVLSSDAKGCMEMYAVQFLGSLVARDGLTCVCVYEAPDVDSVRHAQRTAGLPFKRVYPGWVFAGRRNGNLLGTIEPGE